MSGFFSWPLNQPSNDRQQRNAEPPKTPSPSTSVESFGSSSSSTGESFGVPGAFHPTPTVREAPPRAATPPETTKQVRIAVMGLTGAGKTEFINLASGSRLKVGNDVDSCTGEVQASQPFELDGREVVLLDTPGFDDSGKDATTVLRTIVASLERLYRDKVKLHGVIYVHPIHVLRVGGLAKANFSIFRSICGDNTLKNVVILTNIWGSLPSEEEGIRRVAQLRNLSDFFKPALEKGAQMAHNKQPSCETTHEVLRLIINNHPLALNVQKELVDQGKNFAQTTAGREVDKRLTELEDHYKAELQSTEKRWKKAQAQRDTETKKEMEEVKEQLQKDIEKARREKENQTRDYEAFKKKMEAAEKERKEQEARREKERKEREERQERERKEQEARRERERKEQEERREMERQREARRERERREEEAKREKSAREESDRQLAEMRRQLEEAERRAQEASASVSRKYSHLRSAIIDGSSHYLIHANSGLYLTIGADNNLALSGDTRSPRQQWIIKKATTWTCAEAPGWRISSRHDGTRIVYNPNGTWIDYEIEAVKGEQGAFLFRAVGGGRSIVLGSNDGQRVSDLSGYDSTDVNKSVGYWIVSPGEVHRNYVDAVQKLTKVHLKCDDCHLSMKTVEAWFV